jgi:hypothetical protein
MGHATLGMTLEYARILDQTVEEAFTTAVEHMQEGPLSWVPNFFMQEDYTLFVEGDAVSWIRLPIGFCRRNPKLHCESDVKCLLCDRFAVGKEDMPRLKLMKALGEKHAASSVALPISRSLQASREGLDTSTRFDRLRWGWLWACWEQSRHKRVDRGRDLIAGGDGFWWLG